MKTSLKPKIQNLPTAAFKHYCRYNCGKSYKSLSARTYHYNKCHSDWQPFEKKNKFDGHFPCIKCGKVLGNDHSFRTHKSRCSKKSRSNLLSQVIFILIHFRSIKKFQGKQTISWILTEKFLWFLHLHIQMMIQKVSPTVMEISQEITLQTMTATKVNTQPKRFPNLSLKIVRISVTNVGLQWRENVEQENG